MTSLTTRLSSMFKWHREGDTALSPRPRNPQGVETHRAAASLADLAEPGPEGPQPKRKWAVRMPGRRREAAIEKLQAGYDQMLDLASATRQHMADQSRRGELLLDRMVDLPDALQAMPQVSRTQSQMLELMHKQFEAQDRQSSQLNEAMTALARAAEHQSQVLGVLQRQIEQGREDEQARQQNLVQVTAGIERLAGGSEAQTRALHRVADLTGRCDEHVDVLIKRNGRQLTILAAAVGALTLTTALLGGYALILLAGG